MLCYKCQNNIPDNSLVCSRCGAEMSVRARMKNNMGFGTGASSDVFPLTMKWFYILVSFYLFFEAISSFFSAIEYIFGSFNLFSQSVDYDMILTFSQIGAKYKIIDIIYGLVLIFFGASAIFVRNKLVKFKKSAPLLLTLYLIIPTVVNLAYTMALLIVTNSLVPLHILSTAIQLVIQGAIVYANIIYFKKRKHLFKN